MIVYDTYLLSNQFPRYIYYWNLPFLNKAIINKIKHMSHMTTNMFGLSWSQFWTFSPFRDLSARRKPLVGQELLTLPEHVSSLQLLMSFLLRNA